jgi:hypothetical protein
MAAVVEEFVTIVWVWVSLRIRIRSVAVCAICNPVVVISRGEAPSAIVISIHTTRLHNAPGTVLHLNPMVSGVVDRTIGNGMIRPNDSNAPPTES